MTMTRRLVLVGGIAVTALNAVPRLALGSMSLEPVTWQGQALGAPANIILYHSDRNKAERLIRSSVNEAARLEDIFSLYRQDSELSRLNRAGALASPSQEFVELLGICRECWQQSGGFFDPTVQPLWDCLRKHFSQPTPDPAGPTHDDWDEALTKVGFDHVRFDNNRIAFTKPTMALTLNGIAQGYITDRITALLKAGGVKHALIDMGEYRVIGHQPDGKPWQITISQLEVGSKAEASISIADQGLATSSFSGFQFENSGKFNHLLNPKTGYSASLYQYLTVVSDDAARADAWATAFNLMERPEIEVILRNLPNTWVFARRRNGEYCTLNVPNASSITFL
ncbi:FAD:protein FMN transferase [Ochrobactrum chromiisoli]|uniref:FAD:protein FMN transferase n=1 Tax=Ochrobactrum chromiisoli TaxID=2993941 RepID=A0ABT3QU67_9HYPH|nr:FAD:protein FMN transferase [Ochrobactrum chromiisoli]MCX2699174.1 FAD:protein FMN transferase [Ochrobactrum chromiisoli]